MYAGGTKGEFSLIRNMLNRLKKLSDNVISFVWHLQVQKSIIIKLINVHQEILGTLEVQLLPEKGAPSAILLMLIHYYNSTCIQGNSIEIRKF